MINKILEDKSLKPKEKTEKLSQAVMNQKISPEELIDFALGSKETLQATCMEALEYLTKEDPTKATESMLTFALESLSKKAPRLKWESARVIGNIASQFPSKIKEMIKALLQNTKHPGTVVRWSTAYALSEILKLKTEHNKSLTPTLKSICEKEEKNSIQKIYLKGLAAS